MQRHTADQINVMREKRCDVLISEVFHSHIPIEQNPFISRSNLRIESHLRSLRNHPIHTP
ncbi:Uncharacterised protein [Vibrio cholerae]|nr:Uncharacterised protein [Vibrio cholerae]CSI32885.1 Uncharacterised protein [Vibrio cholerae]CSI66623.1 Uncharacterised protein [Vibrio cholerae]